MVSAARALTSYLKRCCPIQLPYSTASTPPSHGLSCAGRKLGTSPAPASFDVLLLGAAPHCRAGCSFPGTSSGCGGVGGRGRGSASSLALLTSERPTSDPQHPTQPPYTHTHCCMTQTSRSMTSVISLCLAVHQNPQQLHWPKRHMETEAHRSGAESRVHWPGEPRAHPPICGCNLRLLTHATGPEGSPRSAGCTTGRRAAGW